MGLVAFPDEGTSGVATSVAMEARKCRHIPSPRSHAAALTSISRF